jgi:hypothetical protein
VRAIAPKIDVSTVERAMMEAVPLATALITPSAETVATVGAEDDHVTVRATPASAVTFATT